MWNIRGVSNIGKRKSNQDYILYNSIKRHKRIIDILILCDGIGEFAKSDKCSELVCKKSMSTICSYIKNRKSRKSLHYKDLSKLIPLLTNLNIQEIDEDAGTTFTAAIIDRKKSSKVFTIIYMWAGDSRIYIKKNNTNLELLTSDHTDYESADKPLICSFNEKGKVIGKIDFGVTYVKDFKYLALTTDGIHDKCKNNELEAFLDYNYSVNKLTNKKLEDNLSYFLEKNISDNYSLIFQYYK